MKLLVVTIVFILFNQDEVLGWRRRRRRRRAPVCGPVNCAVNNWGSWSGCTHHCGNTGTRSRTRTKSRPESCGGTCPYHFTETQPCNRDRCQHGGTPISGSCRCTAAWTGTCCERDVDECVVFRPCQHHCTNVPGHYTCSCQSCYTELGTRCELRQCKIARVCYTYGKINPGNQCQNCHANNKLGWTNNNALKCSDGNLCTRNDRCVNGVCRGTLFTCRSCEKCDGHACQIKAGFCVIDGTCYSHGNIRSGKPCQQCNSNNNKKWTANNNLKCSDNNVKTRNDRCINGECRGQPYTCLACQDHHNDACRLKSGYCVIKYNKVDTCYSQNTAKPGNPCQWCNPGASTTTWTNRNRGVLCNDEDKCTRSDTCQNGQCKGISFSCKDLCQYCNGNDCSLHTGYGYVAGKCTCKIEGRDYNHQQIDSANQCRWCDLHDKSSKTSSTWSNRPTVLCNDANVCTKNDLCQSGRCIGSAYTCKTSYPQSSCIQTLQCVGDGTCRDIMKNSGTICRPALDQCDQPERCNGVLGSCPPKVINSIKLNQGQASITLPNFSSAISFQSSTSNLYLKLNGFSATCGSIKIKWSLLKSTDSCSPRKTSTELPSNKNNHLLAGLSLQNAQAYKIVVQATDIRGQSGLPVCTNDVTIDTTKPTGGWVRDGLGTIDLQYQSTKSISASWGGFQTPHGVARYEVAVSHRRKPTNIETSLQGFTNLKLKVTFTKTFSSITDGSIIIAKLRAFTKAGLYSEISSDGVIVDTSPPSPGSVFDGQKVSSDLRYANWTTIYQASWTNFNDPHTPIMNYEFGVKQKTGGLISSGLTRIGLKNTAIISGLNLASGFQYCALIQGVNAAGLSSQASSNCVLIDHDAPRPGTVNDGSSTDIDFQSTNTVFTANWNGFHDGAKGSGISEYQYKIEDKSGKQVTSWISKGLGTKVSASGLNLLNGNTYYIRVRAIDKVGHYTEVKSDGVYVDTTRPVYTGKIIIEGEIAMKDGETVVYMTSSASLTASWPQFIDKHSGMKKYQWVITEKNAKPTQSSWKDVPGINLATRATLQTLSLTNNKEYNLFIRGFNNAGLHTDAKSSIFVPLSAAPNSGSVSDGHDPTSDLDFQTNATEIYATWTGFESSSVKVKVYYFAVGSCIQGNYHVTNNGFVLVQPPGSTSFGIKGLSLVNGQRYCIKIKAENLAGIQTPPVSSDGFLVDITSPDVQHGRVLDGKGDGDIDYQTSTTELSATWSGIQDHESGINHFEFAVSRNRAGQPDVTSFINVGQNITATLSNLILTVDVYYVMVCAINDAGLKTCLSSDGVLIDPTPPIFGVVYDGILEPDLQYQSSTTKMSANWERIWDLESRVERFEWGIGSSEGDATNVQDFIDVGLQTHVETQNTLALKHGHNYTVFLRSFNQAKGIRELTSNGITVDTTAPTPSDILPGITNSDWKFVQETSTYYSSSGSDIFLNWEDFKEHESEVWYYKWSIGTSECGTQIQPLINIGLSTSANTTGSDVTLRSGIPYYVMVIARNRADLVARACSPPMIFDYTPPSPGNTKVTSSKGEQTSYFSFDEELYVHWAGFEDFESGIAKYEVSIEYGDGSVLNYTRQSTDTIVRISPGKLLPGETYRVELRCINNAGLSTSIRSEEFTLDNTPPVYTKNINALPERRFESDANSLEISWQPFEDAESPVIYYQIGIGTYALGDDIQAFTRNGLSRVYENIELKRQHNDIYYVTVKATNAAYLVSSLLTEVIIIDQTPPTGRNDSLSDGQPGDDIDFMSLQDPVSAHWENIEDLESGIETVEYCVGGTPFNCRIKSFTNIYQNSSFVCSDCKIQTGMILFVKLRVTNTAGLTTIFNSDGVTIDSSPPEIGRVFDGERADAPDVEKVDPLWKPTVTWYGARDLESGVRSCEWKIVEQDGKTEATIFEKKLDIRNITYNVRWTLHADGELQVKTDVSYFNVIQCWNKAGIPKKQYSNGWSAVDEWPVTSYVQDGTATRDLEFDVIGQTIGARWGPFRGDQKDPVIRYEWAVGTYGGLDDVIEFTEAGLVTSVSKSLHDTDATLEPGVRYFVTVRATSLSGRTSNKSSDGFIVDTTIPSGGVVKVRHSITNQEKKEIDLTIFWDGFSDAETGIKSYEYCLGYIKDVCFTTKINAGIATQSSLRNFVPVEKETHHAIVMATNTAGLKTIVSSDAFKIDVTPPVMGFVRDGLDKDLEYINSSVALATTWSEFHDPETGIEKCTLTVSEESLIAQVSMPTVLKMAVNASGSIIHSDLTLTPGLRYLSAVECENPDGFKISSSSNGVIVDDSPPIAGPVFDGNSQGVNARYQGYTNTLYTHWLAASDPESGLKEYLVAVGSGFNEDDIVHEFFSVSLATEAKIGNLTLQSGTTYHVILEIVNKAGLRSRAFSDGVTIDTTSPVISEVKLKKPLASSTFIGPKDRLSGSWNAFDDESDIDFSEYCVGTTVGECQVQEMRRVPGNQTTITCFDCKLKHRHTHFMTIRVWNKAGLFNLATTQGIMADFTPPSSGHVVTDSLHLSCINRCTLAATFNGFNDDESGIKNCEFFVQNTDGSIVTPVKHTTSGNHAVADNLQLQHKETYQTVVTCINTLGEKSIEAYSSPVKIDNTPPEMGRVIISPDRNHDIRNKHSGCHFMNTTLRVYWSGFYDKESGIAGFHVGIGRQPLKNDVVSYQNLRITNEAKFNLDERYGLSQGDTIFATVEATNHAGLTEHVVSLPTRLISETDGNLVSEKDFQCINV